MAVDVCARCGSFVCSDCANVGSTEQILCPSCFHRLEETPATIRSRAAVLMAVAGPLLWLFSGLSVHTDFRVSVICAGAAFFMGAAGFALVRVERTKDSSVEINVRTNRLLTAARAFLALNVLVSVAVLAFVVVSLNGARPSR